MYHFVIDEQQLRSEPYLPSITRKRLFVMSLEEFGANGFERLPVQMQAVFSDSTATPVLDTHAGWSFCRLHAVEITDQEIWFNPIRFVVTDDMMMIVAGQIVGFVESFANNLSAEQLVNRYEAVSPQTLMLRFFDELLLYNSAHIHAIEDDLEALEEEVLENARKELSREIVTLRKLIMRFRHAIEPLIYIVDELSDNEHRLFSSSQVKELRIQSRRASRMMDSAVLLRDYATQVREAYEAERDIKNNDIMKVFTIVTSIFLPLTLIAGWYGMNFKHMPELGWVWGYPMVFALSATVVIAMLVFFKRKKWL